MLLRPQKAIKKSRWEVGFTTGFQISKKISKINPKNLVKSEPTLRISHVIISGPNRRPQALGGLLPSAVQLDLHSVFTFRLTMPIPIFAKND